MLEYICEILKREKMNKKQLVTTKIDNFIARTSPYTLVNDDLASELTKIAKKVKRCDVFVDSLVIKVMVTNINKASDQFTGLKATDIINKDEAFLLNYFFSMNVNLRTETINILFIEIKKEDRLWNLLFDYVISYPTYFLAKRNLHKDFEDLFKNKKVSDFIKHGRKSIVNTLFRQDIRKLYRVNNKSIKLPNLCHSLGDKYVNIKCPICKFKHEIINDTIDEKISVNRKSKKIYFNCIHRGTDSHLGKPYWLYEKYVDSTLSDHAIT